MEDNEIDAQKNYYIPMSDEAFEDIKKGAIEIWQRYDDSYGYATKKVNQIKDIPNVDDNGMFIIAMFDHFNIRELFAKLQSETLKELKDGRLDTEFYLFSKNYD